MSNDQREDLYNAGMLPKLSGRVGNQFESRHKIGDLVTITARVGAVQFMDHKVRYIFDLGPSLSIVDSEHVAPAMEVGKD